MIKAEISFERILGTFVPGALCTIGVWYAHRIVLLAYFPRLNGIDQTATDYNLIWIRIAIFVIASFCIGLAINQLSDIGVALLFPDEAATDKSRGKLRQYARRVLRDISFVGFNKDPRVLAINRYRESGRKRQFAKMVREWAMTNEKNLGNPNEAIAAHQHVVVRLKILSDKSNVILGDEQFHYIFAASLYITAIFLLFNSLISYLSFSFGVEQFNNTIALRDNSSQRLIDIGIPAKAILLFAWLTVTMVSYYVTIKVEKSKRFTTFVEGLKSESRQLANSISKISLLFMILIFPILSGVVILKLGEQNLTSFVSFFKLNFLDPKLLYSVTADLIISWIIWVGGSYFGILFFGYLLKRRFKTFCQYVITLALHFFILEKKGMLNISSKEQSNLRMMEELISLSSEK